MVSVILRKLPTEIATQFEIQHDHCTRMGSALTAAICRLIFENGLPEGLVFDRFTNWAETGTLEGDVIALRLTGALHWLVLNHANEDLIAQYPPNPLDKTKLFGAVCDAIIQHDGFIDDYLSLKTGSHGVISRAAIGILVRRI